MKSDQLPKWDNYWDSVVTEPETGKTKRPPLTGKNRYVPEGLYDQPWDKVIDAYGKATLTPYYIEALTSDDEGDVRFGIYGLTSATTHQGSVSKPAQMAIPFLVDILKNDINGADTACYYLARIALGENHFILTPADAFYQTIYFKSVNKYKKEIKAYYNRTNSEEAMRLLCFLSGVLPDYMDLTYENALLLVKGDENTAYIRQASNLITQGFIAADRNYPEKGYPMYASLIDANNLKLSDHIVETRTLMEESESLLVRGCAAICLAYTGIVDDDILELIAYLGEQKLDHVFWAWDDIFSEIAKNAWMYAADMVTLINSKRFLVMDYTSKTAEGVETTYFTAREQLIVAARRFFPARNTKTGESLPLLPTELTITQKKVIKRIIDDPPRIFGSPDTHEINLPTNRFSALRLIEESEEILCTKIDGVPLWFILEKSVFEKTPGVAVHALEKVDAWKVLTEIYRPFYEIFRPYQETNVEEGCTLNLKAHSYDEKGVKREEMIQDILADSLYLHSEQVKVFLDEWLVKSEELQGNDWKKIPGQRIGICLLSLARNDALCKKFFPLVRPCHPNAHASSFPIHLLKEVLEHTSKEHQMKIKDQFKI